MGIRAIFSHISASERVGALRMKKMNRPHKAIDVKKTMNGFLAA